MYCKHCGQYVSDVAQTCPHCGAAMNDTQTQKEQYSSNIIPQTNSMAIAGFVLSFFVAIAGLICSIIGYKRAATYGSGKGLATAGIIISGFALAFQIIFLIIRVGALLGALSEAAI